MPISKEDVAVMVFHRVAIGDPAKFGNDRRLLDVLRSMDGKHTLGEVSAILGLSLNETATATARLRKLQFIELCGTRPEVLTPLDSQFMDTLNSEMALAVGPFSVVLIEDTASDLGYHPNNLPRYCIRPLIDKLASAIENPEKRTRFLNAMNKLAEQHS